MIKKEEDGKRRTPTMCGSQGLTQDCGSLELECEDATDYEATSSQLGNGVAKGKKPAVECACAAVLLEMEVEDEQPPVHFIDIQDIHMMVKQETKEFSDEHSVKRGDESDTSSTSVTGSFHGAPEENHQCDVCSKIFLHDPLMIGQTLTRVQYLMKECTACAETFPIFVCNLCDNTTKLSGTAFPHECSSGEKCEECGRRCSYAKNNGWRHQCTAAGNELFECHVCNKKFLFEVHLASHGHSHAEGHAFQCKQCSQGYAHKGNLLQHQIVTHSLRRETKDYSRHVVSKRSYVPIKPFKCDQCNKAYQRPESYRQHMETKHDTAHKPFECEFCAKAFGQWNQLVAHIRLHSGERSFSCQFCAKMCQSNAELIAHERRHTGDRPFTCDVCKKSFFSRSERNIHQRVHTGEKPCVCQICKKAFRTPSLLAEHRQIHNGKLHECEVCRKTFSRPSNLREHMQNHHTGEKSYKCDICRKGLGSKRSLNNHRRTQHGKVN